MTLPLKYFNKKQTAVNKIASFKVKNKNLFGKLSMKTLAVMENLTTNCYLAEIATNIQECEA